MTDLPADMGRGKLVERLNAAADDPMWADHAEVPKITLRKAAARITELETELAAAQHQVKGALVMYDALVVKLEAKEAELAAMKARGNRLAEIARHASLCNFITGLGDGLCDCGLDQALTEWRDQ